MASRTKAEMKDVHRATTKKKVSLSGMSCSKETLPSFDRGKLPHVHLPPLDHPGGVSGPGQQAVPVADHVHVASCSCIKSLSSKVPMARVMKNPTGKGVSSMSSNETSTGAFLATPAATAAAVTTSSMASLVVDS